jgi:hypothetical protein
MAWSKNGTPDTLSSAGDTMTISDLTAKKFIVILNHALYSVSTINSAYRFDNNSNTDYARRYSTNGGTDGTGINETNIIESQYASDFFDVAYVANIDGEEKLCIFHNCEATAVGASSAPRRREVVGKVDTTTNSGQFTRVDSINTAAGDYDTDSNLSAIGTD